MWLSCLAALKIWKLNWTDYSSKVKLGQNTVKITDKQGDQQKQYV